MDEQQAADDLALVRRILDATHRRVDPQMFHFIIWGAIVLVWYPLDQWLEANEYRASQAPLAICALVLGSSLSIIGGYLANRRPRLVTGDPGFSTRIAAACGVFIGTGVACSVAIALSGENVRWTPHLWGLMYALMLMTLGVFYSSECFLFGLLALAGTIAAAWQRQNAGYILGLSMGIAAVIPGLMAERRVRRLQQEAVNVDGG
jgi:hypothetical protein